MPVDTHKKLFSVDEYYRMSEVGILGRGDRVELIGGEIIQMTPVGIKHAGCVNIATELFTSVFKGQAVVSVQNPLRLDDHTEPQPDIVLLNPRLDRYRTKRAEAQDALLVLEVADTTLDYDRGIKLSHYAKAGIPEVWIEDIQGDCILVHREPSDEAFRIALTLTRGDRVSIHAFPAVSFTIDELLGC